MQARFGDVSSDAIVVHAADGYVDSSNYVGCDASSGAPTALLGLLGLGLVRRRRKIYDGVELERSQLPPNASS